MKQKIAFIASYPQSLLNFRLDLMKVFLKLGYEVIAIAPHDQRVADSLSALNIKFIAIPLQRNGLNPFADMILIRNLYRILSKHQPELVFAYTIKPIIYGTIAAKLARIPKIYSMITGTGYIFLEDNIKSKVVGWLAQRLFKIALYFNALVFFQNKDNLAFFRQKKILSMTKATAVINGSGVDCHYFSKAPFPKQCHFLMIARFLYDKGVREYVQAAKEVKAQFPEVKCYLVGWIDTNPNAITEQELNTWIAEGSIEYMGKLSDVREIISQSSVYVLPSYHEGTPRTVLEAMAMGRPIITTDVPGCRETVIPNENGFLIPAKTIAPLVKAMTHFIKTPDDIAKMGEGSRILAIKKYDVHLVNESILTAMNLSNNVQLKDSHQIA